MNNIKVMNSKKIFIAAFFLGAVTFGFSQDTLSTNQSEEVQTRTSSQNPAIDGLKKQIAANPNDTDAIVKLAAAYQEAQDWTNALATWKSMSALLPDWAPAYYSQAYVYQSMKDEENAKASYEKYIASVKPTELEANKQNLGYAHFFVAYKLQQTNKEQAKQHIAKSLEYDASNAEAVKLKEVLNQ